MANSELPQRRSRIFLLVMGVLYIGLGLWCAFLPEKTSDAVGFILIQGRGQSEYLAVYGGLEIGLGAFCLWSTHSRSAARAGIVAAFLIHAAIVVARSIGFILYTGIGSTTKYLAAVEWAIVIVAAMCRESPEKTD